MLQTYLHRFTHLHTAANRTHWTADTRHKAPNKPMLWPDLDALAWHRREVLR